MAAATASENTRRSENFGSFRHRFVKASLSGDSFGFFRGCFGSFRLRERKREGGRRRGGSGEGIPRRRRGTGSQHLALWVGKVKEKKDRPRGGPEKVARDKSSKRGERCARPLRRLPARIFAPAQGGSGG
ncbi:uncharacterized protein LOC126943261 isoform X1 [Macaca thibetana thibetana]|uniref:uncharacterized protein LOC126943261 isoform X1 n=1 Tax=Macaca thibetana thibetana TaxID=257877 RepID=UPI0021BC5646|nr:uncharacterized protein LOC126943261 isoform X1 [Macaca thibetana thibetana]